MDLKIETDARHVYHFPTFSFRRHFRRFRRTDNRLPVDLRDSLRGGFPADLPEFLPRLFRHLAGQGGVFQDGDDLGGDLPDVPEIDLQRVLEDLGDTRLAGDDHRNVIQHRLEGGDAERFGDARHDVEVAQGEDPLDLLPLEESREMKTVPDPQLADPFDHLPHHVAGAGHDEGHVGKDLEDPGPPPRRSSPVPSGR